MSGMFQGLRDGHKLGAIAWKWAGCTGVDPGDRGQIAKLASKCVVDAGIAPEDAWVMALVHWMNGMPWPDSQLMVAQALTLFLETYEGKVALSAATIVTAREAANWVERAAQKTLLVKQHEDEHETRLAEFNAIWDKAWEDFETGEIEYDEMRDRIRENVIRYV